MLRIFKPKKSTSNLEGVCQDVFNLIVAMLDYNDLVALSATNKRMCNLMLSENTRISPFTRRVINNPFFGDSSLNTVVPVSSTITAEFPVLRKFINQNNKIRAAIFNTMVHIDQLNAMQFSPVKTQKAISAFPIGVVLGFLLYFGLEALFIYKAATIPPTHYHNDEKHCATLKEPHRKDCTVTNNAGFVIGAIAWGIVGVIVSMGLCYLFTCCNLRDAKALDKEFKKDTEQFNQEYSLLLAELRQLVGALNANVRSNSTVMNQHIIVLVNNLNDLVYDLTYRTPNNVDLIKDSITSIKKHLEVLLQSMTPSEYMFVHNKELKKTFQTKNINNAVISIKDITNIDFSRNDINPEYYSEGKSLKSRK